MLLIHAYALLAADVLLAVFAPAFPLSLHDRKFASRPPKPIASDIMDNNKKNMRNSLIFVVTILLILTACNNKKGQESQPLPAKTDSVKLIDKSIEFLDLFKTINPNGLHIYPPTWDSDGKIHKTPFEGNPINIDKFTYVDNEEIFFNLTACKQGLSNIYAVGKFEINNEYFGLIVRQYSQYDESLVQLLLWNKKENKIEKGIDLADSFGDEGWYFDLESWIEKFKYNSTLEIVSRRKDYLPKVDFTSNEDMDSITTDTLKISRLINSKFVTRLGNQQDTIKYQLKNWK
jgi:hypothetical protein